MFSIEEIERIMDDTAEAVEKQREIDQLLSGQLTSEDEDQVLEELERLAAEEEEQETVPTLPEAPTDELPESEKERRIKGWLGKNSIFFTAALAQGQGQLPN